MDFRTGICDGKTQRANGARRRLAFAKHYGYASDVLGGAPPLPAAALAPLCSLPRWRWEAGTALRGLSQGSGETVLLQRWPEGSPNLREEQPGHVVSKSQPRGKFATGGVERQEPKPEAADPDSERPCVGGQLQSPPPLLRVCRGEKGTARLGAVDRGRREKSWPAAVEDFTPCCLPLPCAASFLGWIHFLGWSLYWMPEFPPVSHPCSYTRSWHLS